MIAGDRKSCNANKVSLSVRPPMCGPRPAPHSRPRLKHSRAGYSGNPYSTSLRGELASLEDSYPAHAQWIPSPPSRGLKAAGMTGWPRARATRLERQFTPSKGMPAKAMARGQRLASGYDLRAFAHTDTKSDKSICSRKKYFAKSYDYRLQHSYAWRKRYYKQNS